MLNKKQLNRIEKKMDRILNLLEEKNSVAMKPTKIIQPKESMWVKTNIDSAKVAEVIYPSATH